MQNANKPYVVYVSTAQLPGAAAFYSYHYSFSQHTHHLVVVYYTF